jgi:two-component system, cell cycle sensor histidine kinase and response regulator CckA
MTNDHANNDSGKKSMDPSAKGFNASESMEELLLIREKYKSLYERKLHCIYVHDLEGNFLDANDTSLKLLGYKRNEILSLNFTDLIEDDFLSTAYNTVNEIRSDGCQQNFTEYKLKTRDGSYVWLETDGSLLYRDGKPYAILGVARDITSRKKAEAALRESRAKYKQLVEHAPAGIYEVDLTTQRFIRVNDIMRRVTGYSREELLAMNPMDILTESSREQLTERAVLLFSGKQVPPRVEFEIRTKDGRRLWVLVTSKFTYQEGNPVRATVVISDITEQKKAEDALRLSEEKYRLLVDNARDAIFILQNGQIKFPNKKAKEIGAGLGLQLDRVSFVDYIHPEDRDKIIDRYTRRLNGEHVPNPFVFRIIGRDGREMWSELNSVKIDWEGGPATLNFLRDITLQRKLEQRLQISQKMEAVGTLAGGIAHDFNNLLMGIQGRTSLMLLETNSVHPYYEHLKEIENYVVRAAELTKQLLGFARGGKYEVRPTDLNDLVAQSLKMFGRTKKEITIKTKYQEDLETVAVDRSQIDQVLLNIYVNAWQAMYEGGIIYVQTRSVDLYENFVCAYGVSPGKYAAISITDTGIGMEKETARRVFDPFFTTKEKDRGTGLGLASAYGIVKNHDGIITVESENGQGATFTIYLPVSGKEVINDKGGEPEIITGSETILLVDDEQMIIDVGSKLLQRMGYRVLTAGHGNQAIEIYRQNKGAIAVVILDLIMPQVGGGEVYDRLKEIDPQVKVLLSSGYSVAGQAAEILKRGCNGFIQKPFRPEALSKKIREILSQPKI